MFIMFVIVLSSIALASEDPVNEESPRNVFLGKADYAFTAIFTMECTLKVRLFMILLDILFSSNRTTFIKVRVAFVFELQTL